MNYKDELAQFCQGCIHVKKGLFFGKLSCSKECKYNTSLRRKPWKSAYAKRKGVLVTG